jgi:hypothetical protein
VGIVVLVLVAVPLLALSFGTWFALLSAALRVRPWRWRILFLVLFAFPFILAVLEEVFPLYTQQEVLGPVLAIALVLGMGIIAWLDWRQPTRYPWTHWAGLLCCGWLIIAFLLGAVVNQFS